MLCRRKDGSTFYVDIRSSLVILGGQACIVGLFTDTSERKQAETERRRMESMLQHAQKMQSVGVMASGIAHSFNNILGAIRGYADMTLAVTPQGKRTYSYVESIVGGIDDAAQLVKKMLVFSRHDKPDFMATHLRPVIEDAVDLFGKSMTTPIGVRLQMDTPCGKVWADASQMRQVVMNLCSNAYHAALETGGVLEVGLDEVDVGADPVARHASLRSGRYVRLRVTDTGHGIDPAVLQYIFEPFFTTKDVGRGTGLGLAIVHGIVMNHRGGIVVESEIGKGTTCDVYLPLA